MVGGREGVVRESSRAWRAEEMVVEGKREKWRLFLSLGGSSVLYLCSLRHGLSTKHPLSFLSSSALLLAVILASLVSDLARRRRSPRTRPLVSHVIILLSRRSSVHSCHQFAPSPSVPIFSDTWQLMVVELRGQPVDSGPGWRSKRAAASDHHSSLLRQRGVPKCASSSDIGSVHHRQID